MKQVFLTFCLLCGWASAAQTRLPDGTWEDRGLAFLLLDESVRNDDQCIQNLTVGFTVRVFDRAGKEIWNSVWTGRTMDIQFSKPLPQAARLEIEASGNFVVNRTTANRISTREPLTLSVSLNETTKP
jgi:hypothetical protein